MPNSKEMGVIVGGQCPLCKEELFAGWSREIPKLPAFNDSVSSAQPVSDANEVLVGGACVCGNLTATFSPATGRVAFAWTDPNSEPRLFGSVVSA